MFEFNSLSANQRESLQRFIHREKFTSMLRKVKATLRKLTKEKYYRYCTLVFRGYTSDFITHFS